MSKGWEKNQSKHPFSPVRKKMKTVKNESV